MVIEYIKEGGEREVLMSPPRSLLVTGSCLDFRAGEEKKMADELENWK